MQPISPISRQTVSKERQVFDLRRERGATFVEFATLLPILLLILFGIIQVGILLHASISLNNAAELAARLSTLGTTPPSQNDIQAAAREALSSTLVDSNNVLVTTYTVGEDIGGGQSGNTVVLSYNHSLTAPFVFGNLGTVSLSAKAVMY